MIFAKKKPATTMSLEDFSIITVLGRGSFGKVYLA
jgi:hypothetical protein